MKTYDVVIIGAGLAGLQCAKLLSLQGAKVLLVDRKTDLSKGIHTTGIFVRKTFEDFEFPAECLGNPIRHVTLFSPTLKSIKLASDKDEFRVGKMGKLYESFLQECIDNGVEFLNGTRYVSAETHSNETIVSLEKNSESLAVKTKVLVGADGASSRVARDLELEENREWIVGYEEVFHRNLPTTEPRLYCFLDAELAPGYLAWIADDGEEIHIGVGGYAASFNPREALKKFKRKMTKKLINLEQSERRDFVGGIEQFCQPDSVPIETRGGVIPVGGILKRIANENGLLIGDAAGAVSPLTAGGLDPCMRLSAMAANVILERLKTNDSQILLKFSGDLFRARFVSRLWMRRIIAAVSNQKLLEFGFRFLRGKIGRKFAEHVFFGRGSFPDVEIGQSAAHDSIKVARAV